MISSEADRLRILRSYAVLDTEPDPSFDRITALARLMFEAPIAVISLVDDERQWFKSCDGLDTCQTPRDEAFCAHALPLERGAILTVEDATRDPRFARNPSVTGAPHIRFYAGAVLTSPEGANLGTLCIIDSRPRGALTPLQAKSLRALADLAMSELEVRRARRDDAAKREILDLAESMSGVGHWRLEIATGAVDWSDEVYHIHGVDRASFDPALDNALEFYDEAGRAAVNLHIETALRDRAGYAFHLRIRRADGQWREVVCKAACEFGVDGTVEALVGVFKDVTEEENLLRQVRQDGERYRLLTQNATDVIAAYTPDGTFTYLSPSVASVLDRTPRELLGTKTYGLIHPDDHARVTREFGALLTSGAHSARIEYRALRRDGGCVWVEAHPSPILDAQGVLTGFQDVVRDIGARRTAQEAAAEATHRAEAALASAQASEARYRLLAENANDMISTSSLDSTLLFLTPAVRRVLGYEPEELIGTKTLALTHPDDTPAVVALFTRLVQSGPSTEVTPYQFRGRHKDGRWVWLEGQPRVQFDDAGRPLAFQDVVRDIQERRRVEMELEEAKVAAEAAAQAKADFLANMSHELRTPLTSILGYTALASEQPELSTLTRDYVRRVQNASRALLSTVNDILDFSKLEAGQVSIAPAPTDAVRVCRDAVELFAPEAAAKALRLGLDVVGEPPPTVLIDADRLLQILLNLVGNAVKFTERGAVAVALRHAHDRLTIEVRDTGPGIGAEAQRLLFKRFSQVDGSSTRSHGGSGLGLAICKGLADRMGGAISVESEAGVGSLFTVVLAAPRVAPAPAPCPAMEGMDGLEAVRVLVVDDNPANRDLARIFLAGAGAEVTEAASGKDALETLARAPFDAVLLDLRMPDLDGATVLHRLRGAPGPNDAIPVIAYTADAPGFGFDHRTAGFDGVAHKPLQPAKLLAALKLALDGEASVETRAHA